MKNPERWRPTKFVRTPRGLRASDDPRDLAPGSRLVGDLLARAYEAAIREHARGRLLDVGCGLVPLYETYRGVVDEAICIDWAESEEGRRHLDHVCDLNEGIPLPDGSFDTVLATDVLEHMRRPETLFLAMARVLRPGGKLILGVPFLYWIHEEPQDFHRYTEFKLRDFCHTSGLEVLSLKPYGGSPDVFADLIGKHLAGLRWLSAFYAAAMRLAASSGPWTRFSRATAHRFPLGYLLVARR